MGGYQAIAQIGMQAASMAAQNQQAKDAANAQQEQMNLQNEQLWRQQQQQAGQRRDLLKQQLASSRAALAAGGVGFGGGSGQALLAGMTRRAEQDIADDFDAAMRQHRVKFGTGEQPRTSGAQGLMQGLETAQRGYQILRPIYDRP